MKLHGVNLGGWLVLEKWITPTLFSGLNANDETAFCIESGKDAGRRLEAHWSTWITESDFEWIAASGLNAVRIPVGHWIFGDVKPYIGAIEYLDWAFTQAEKNKLSVVIDLHGAPGSQNGWDHSGLAGTMSWHKGLENKNRSLDIISRLAERYCTSPALFGIEVINEPRWDIPGSFLLDYYEDSYYRIRQHCSEKIAAIISDAFDPNTWSKKLNDKKYHNLILDMHLYQCFSAEDKKLSFTSHINKASDEWLNLIKRVQQNKPAVIGEWSLALPANVYASKNENEIYDMKKAYAIAQLDTFNEAEGWFYWCYKTEENSDWNYRYCHELGLFKY